MPRWCSAAILLAFMPVAASCTPTPFSRSFADDLDVTSHASESDIQEALKPRELTRPKKVAFAFRRPAGLYQWPRWNWEEADLQAVQGLGGQLVREGLVASTAEADPISAYDARQMRFAATKVGADAVLITSGGGEMRRYENGWAVLYLLFVPAFFVPGTTTDALFAVQMQLVDVRSGQTYFTVSAEGSASDTTSFFVVDYGAVVTAAKTKALAAVIPQARESFAKLPKP